MKKYVTVILILLFPIVYAQNPADNVVRGFYEVLNSGDSLKIRNYFHTDALIEHMDGDTSYTLNLDEFLGVSPKFKSKIFQEEILHIDYKMGLQGYVEYVKVYFKFFHNGEYSHCGVDHFVFSVDEKFHAYIDKIYSVPCNCWEEPITDDGVDTSSVFSNLDDIMNSWHENAWDADYELYFDLMADNFYFLGTDPNERWSKSEFSSFCKPYFDKGQAWEFEANWRNWYISEDGNTAWFDESLNTWMDECRGSGVLQKIDGSWKLYHYNLTVLIENEKMDKFIKLRKK